MTFVVLYFCIYVISCFDNRFVAQRLFSRRFFYRMTQKFHDRGQNRMVVTPENINVISILSTVWRTEMFSFLLLSLSIVTFEIVTEISSSSRVSITFSNSTRLEEQLLFSESSDFNPTSGRTG